MSIRIYGRQSFHKCQRWPIIGLPLSSTFSKNFRCVLVAILAVFLGAIGVWLPALINTLHTAVPFVVNDVITRMSETSGVDGSLLILVPSLIAPCALLLFGPWDQKDRIDHQILLITFTVALYASAFIIVITQLSGGVADKVFLLRASWSTLAASGVLLYFYELLKIDIDIVKDTRSVGEKLAEQTLRNLAQNP